jgi:hypothetical protein
LTVSTVDTLGDYGQELLDACLAALATTDAGAPAYRCLSPGLPAFDCPEGVWVWVGGIGEEATQPGSPAPVTGRRTQFGQLILATLLVSVTRCIPESSPLPPVDVLQAVYRQVNQDVWAIWNHLFHLIREGQIFDGACSINHFDVGAPLATSGGSAGWTFQVRPQINGYIPIGSS